MKRVVVACASLAIASVGLIAPASAAPNQFKTCAQVHAISEFGVAKDVRGVNAAQKAGLVPPTVNKSIYDRATKLNGKKPRGYVCGITQQAARQTNVAGYFANYDNTNPDLVLTGMKYAVAKSPAANYLGYFAEAQGSLMWNEYLSRGLTPPVAPVPTTVLNGNTITVTSGGTVTDFAAEFDPYGKLVTWSTTVGPLANRLFPVQGSSANYGMLIELDWTYRTLLGFAASTGYATNSSGRPLRLNRANYTAPDGVTYEGYTNGSPCIPNGQRIPIYPATDSAAPAGASGKWQFQVLDCNFYATGFIDVNFGPRS